MMGLIDPVVGEWQLSSANTNELRHLMGYVIQDSGLFRRLTSAGNVSLLARFFKRPGDELARASRNWPRWCSFSRTTDALPKNFYGGWQLRISLMRNLMLDREIVLARA